MAILFNNIKYAIRVLAKRPRFSLIIITILALGIGANTAIFSVINTVLHLKSFPYDHPERIVFIHESLENEAVGGVGVSNPTVDYWRQHNTVFEDIALVQSHRFYIETGRSKPFHTWAQAVSSGYFSIMGMRPSLGRNFVLEDEQPGHEQVVMLSHEFWTQHFGADPEAVGQSLVLNEKAYTIIGVMPVEFGEPVSGLSMHSECGLFWVPLPLDLDDWSAGSIACARLKPGVSLDQANTEMSLIEERLIQKYPQEKMWFKVEVFPYFEDQLNHSRTYLYPLWGAIGLVLLIGCLNASGLFLVHGDMLRKEIAIRIALGASRVQVMGQLLIEGVILSGIAGIVGLFLAHWAIKALVTLAPTALPRLNTTQMDMTTLGFTMMASILTGVAFSLIPAWKVTGFRLSESIKQGFHGQVRHQHHVQGCLVIGQIGIALTLVLAVALLVQTIVSIYQADLGFHPDRTLVVAFELPEVKYPQHRDVLSIFQQLQQRMQVQPGVVCAAYISGGFDLGGITGGGYYPLTIDGAPPAEPGQEPYTLSNDVSSDYFRAMGINILRGRGFTEEDVQQKARVCVVDENMVKRHFVGQDPLTQSIDGRRIIGVVSTLKDPETMFPDLVTLYLPVTSYCSPGSDLIIKTSGDPLALTDVVKAQVAELDPDLAITDMYALKDRLGDMLAPRRYMTLLLGLFALMALLLAAIGIYGLLRYMVEQRFNEIGIRIALGATTGNITRAFLRKGVILLLVGTGLGLIGGYAAQKTLASFLYQAQLTNLVLLTVAIVILFATGLLACYIPARRAAKIDPMEALRYE